jgi:hypothetical protein
LLPAEGQLEWAWTGTEGDSTQRDTDSLVCSRHARAV